MKEQKIINPKIRWWDFLAALLFVIAMVTSASRLVAAQWVQHLNLVQTVAILGAIAGLALGQSRFDRRIAALFGLLYGAYVISWQLGLTLGDKIAWMERVTSMVGRIEIIINSLFNRKPITDNLFFLLLMASLYWLISVYGGYQLTRHANIWLSVLPAGLAAFVIHSFDPLLAARTWYLAAYIFLVLLLMARVTFLKQHKRWEENHTHIPPDASLDLARVATGISAVVILLAWNLPALSSVLPGMSNIWATANQPWLTFKDKMSFAFASLRASVGLVSDYYGDQQVLGLGSVHTDSVVMVVEAPSNPYPGMRYYWKARTYENYADGLWLTNLRENRPYSPAENPLNQGDVGGRIEGNFKFTPYSPIITLYTVPQVAWVSRPGKIQFGSNPDQTLDIVGVSAQPFIKPGETYQVRSLLSSFSQADLRQAGTVYPQWIVDRYLQLPSNISPRTIDLARSIAEGLDNPYDIAEAVTEYLREYITYSETIAPVPANAEPLDWFLFEYKTGFCNYYASAEVILLRSLGIPARFAVGYAQGTRQATTDEALPQELRNIPSSSIDELSKFTVTQADSHAWPEVYFPGLGWIEFEPTVSQNPILRPSGDSSALGPQEAATPDALGIRPGEDPFLTPSPESSGIGLPVSTGISPVTVVSLIILFLAASIVIYALLTRHRETPITRIWRRIIGPEKRPIPVRLEKGLRKLGIRPPDFLIQWAHYSLLSLLARAYLEINHALNRLGQPASQSATPAERRDALVKLLPLTEKPAQQLVSAYEASMYSDHPIEAPEARQAGSEIRRLSYLAKLHNFMAGYQESDQRGDIFRGKHES